MSECLVAWRLTSRRYADLAFAGEGARRYGGRWNSPGTPMVYLAGSLALAALEQLVHLSRVDLLEGQFVRFRVRFPLEVVLTLEQEVLPEGWTERRAVTRQIGDGWAKAQDALVLRVPSAVVPEEANYLVNPLHPDREVLEVGGAEPFVFDRRLLEAHRDT